MEDSRNQNTNQGDGEHFNKDGSPDLRFEGHNKASADGLNQDGSLDMRLAANRTAVGLGEYKEEDQGKYFPKDVENYQQTQGRGWHGDPEGHAKAGRQSHKNSRDKA